MKSFWMVWVAGRSGPTHQHMEYPDAMIEAERLARMNPTVSVIILEAIQVCHSEQPVVWENCE